MTGSTLTRVRASTRPIPAPAAGARGAAPRTHAVTLIPGDGVGPDVVYAAVRVLDAAGARIDWEYAEAGARALRRGVASGLPADTLDSVRRTGAALAGPLAPHPATGAGGADGLRRALGTWAGLRPVRELPGIPGRGTDLVIVREGVEDVHGATETVPAPGHALSVRPSTRRGCERITRLAFEVALAERRSRVQCATRADLLPLAEGMMRRAFERVAGEYPGVGAEHLAADEIAGRLAMDPAEVEVVAAAGAHGDLLAGVAMGLVGGRARVPVVDLGDGVAVFGVAHGPASRLSSLGIANPTAILLAAVHLLRHLGEGDTAETVEHAVVLTLDQGIRTPDVPGRGTAVGTTIFADAVISNLGRRLPGWRSRARHPVRLPARLLRPEPETARRVVGVDVLVEAATVPELLARGWRAPRTGRGSSCPRCWTAARRTPRPGGTRSPAAACGPASSSATRRRRSPRRTSCSSWGASPSRRAGCTPRSWPRWTASRRSRRGRGAGRGTGEAGRRAAYPRPAARVADPSSARNSPRAASEMATTTGCFSLRSTETA
ncbi:MAG TPA: isocitrate/isopropylmalate family dehydrogenase [Longimicrobiaceae bacterium]|nr:isocitrate/isopropylmalate family dehydrogenase [Longimicrobiaceae bacterium]